MCRLKSPVIMISEEEVIKFSRSEENSEIKIGLGKEGG